MSEDSASDALNLCFFSHSSSLAGAERTLLELVTQLIEDFGVRCTVIVPGEGPLIYRLRAAGAEVLRTEYDWWCDTRRIPEAEARRKMDQSVARLRREVLPVLEELDPDVVCTQTLVIPYGAIAASALGKPHIWNLREQGEADGFQFFRPFGEISAFIHDHSDFLFGANTSLCQQVVPGLSTDVHDVLYPMVDVSRVPSDPAEVPMPETPGAFRLVEFATIAHSKRLDVAIEAVGELTRRGRMVELAISGERFPDCFADLERLIEDLGLEKQIDLRDFVEDVFPAMTAADAVVISAPVHSFGRTAAEGMMCAKPVVYPLGTGFDDYLEDGVTGLGYLAADPRSMADRIEVLLDDPDLCRTLGQTAHASARARFTKTEFGAKFFARALALKGRPPKTGKPSASASCPPIR